MTPPLWNHDLAQSLHIDKYHLWALETPTLPGISNYSFCGGSMDIFWNYTM